MQSQTQPSEERTRPAVMLLRDAVLARWRLPAAGEDAAREAFAGEPQTGKVEPAYSAVQG